MLTANEPKLSLCCDYSKAIAINANGKTAAAAALFVRLPLADDGDDDVDLARGGHFQQTKGEKILINWPGEKCRSPFSARPFSLCLSRLTRSRRRRRGRRRAGAERGARGGRRACCCVRKRGESCLEHTRASAGRKSFCRQRRKHSSSPPLHVALVGESCIHGGYGHDGHGDDDDDGDGAGDERGGPARRGERGRK